MLMENTDPDGISAPVVMREIVPDSLYAKTMDKGVVVMKTMPGTVKSTRGSRYGERNVPSTVGGEVPKIVDCVTNRKASVASLPVTTASLTSATTMLGTNATAGENVS